MISRRGFLQVSGAAWLGSQLPFKEADATPIDDFHRKYPPPGVYTGCPPTHTRKVFLFYKGRRPQLGHFTVASADRKFVFTVGDPIKILSDGVFVDFGYNPTAPTRGFVEVEVTAIAPGQEYTTCDISLMLTPNTGYSLVLDADRVCRGGRFWFLGEDTDGLLRKWLDMEPSGDPRQYFSVTDPRRIAYERERKGEKK